MIEMILQSFWPARFFLMVKIKSASSRAMLRFLADTFYNSWSPKLREISVKNETLVTSAEGFFMDRKRKRTRKNIKNIIQTLEVTVIVG